MLSAEAQSLIVDATAISTDLEDHLTHTHLTARERTAELEDVSGRLQAKVDLHPGLDRVLRGGRGPAATHALTVKYLDRLVPGAGGDVAVQSIEARRVVAAVGAIQVARLTVLTRLASQAA